MTTNHPVPASEPSLTAIPPATPAKGPDGPALIFAEDELDALLARQQFMGGTRELDPNELIPLNDFAFKWASRFWEKPIYQLAWPNRLYIPGEADYRPHWPFPPPHDHVYQHDWTGSTSSPKPATANNGIGALAATVSAATLKGTNRSWAGIALEYTPEAALSQVRFSAEVAALAVYRYAVLLNSVGSANFHSYATVFLLGWEISPVTGKWEQLPQFGRHTVFSWPAWGQASGMPQTSPVTLPLDALSANFLVERHKRYAFGVLFQTTVVADMREPNGQSVYQPRPDDVIQVQSSLSGSVPRMSIDTTVTYQA